MERELKPAARQEGEEPLDEMLQALADYEKEQRLAALLDHADDPAAHIANNKDAAFYDGQIKAATYFISSQLPVTVGKINAILEGDASVILEAAERSFGG